jgi:hypothetical protein
LGRKPPLVSRPGFAGHSRARLPPTQLPSNPFDFDGPDESGVAGPGVQESPPAGAPRRAGLFDRAAVVFEGVGLRFEPNRKHSGLGIASFLIAVMVGGMDVILALVIVVNAAGSADRDPGLEGLPAHLAAGGLAMYCLNCMSLPLCLVGAGMGVVGLVAHRQHNHFFTWLGLGGNGVIILGVVGFYLFLKMRLL